MTTAELEPIEPASLVTSSELELITRTIAKGATPENLQLFLRDCQRRGVHPLDKLLIFTQRKDQSGQQVYTPITSIDYMRSRAEATGAYAGSDDAVFTGTEGDVEDDFRATVTVWRFVQGERCAFAATARWSEYSVTGSGGRMWTKMPHTMLAKCAEALALRKAFPQSLAGLYASEEMDQAGVRAINIESEEVQPEAEPPSEDTRLITEKQRKRLYAIAKGKDRDMDDVKAYIQDVYGYESSAEIQRKDYEAICAWCDEA